MAAAAAVAAEATAEAVATVAGVATVLGWLLNIYIVPWSYGQFRAYQFEIRNQMAAVLRRLADPDEAAQELVRMANESGGRDNITVVIVDVVDDDGRAAQIEAAREAAAAALLAAQNDPDERSLRRKACADG